MTTIAKDVGRADIALHIGSDESIGVKWSVDKRDGNGYVPKDLSKWTAKFELHRNNQVIYQQPCMTTSNGYAIAKIPASAFENTFWLTRDFGDWKIFGFGPNGEKELLGWGAYKLI